MHGKTTRNMHRRLMTVIVRHNLQARRSTQKRLASCVYAEYTELRNTTKIHTNKMTKADIINEIVEKTGIARKDATIAIEAFMEVVKSNMVNKRENIYLRGFGSFNVKQRAAKTARNISKNTTITIPAHDIPAFKPAKSFLQMMKGEEVTAED